MKEDIYTTKDELIQRIKNLQDDNAWSEFQQFYWDTITGWAIKMGCTHTLAQDIFQETIISLLKYIEKFDSSKGSFRGFLKTIVLRRVSDAFRREKRYINMSDYTENDSDLMENIAGTTDNAEQIDDDNIWIQGILSQALRQSYKRVDELTYKSFCLYVLENHPVKEVCEKLSIKREGTIYQHKNRFLVILKEEFCFLLKDLGETEINKNILQNDTLFTKLLEELIKNRPDFRETVVYNTPPAHLINQIEFIKPFLTQNQEKCNKNSTLLILHKTTSNNSFVCKDIQILLPEVTIGRSDKSTIQLDKKNVSGLHATIKKIDKTTYVVTDENSTNGVYLNNNPIKEETILRNGDIIQITENYLLIVSLL